MNLYVFFAIAFGAISGFSEPPVAPRVFAQIVDVRKARAARREIAAGRGIRVRFASRRPSRPAILALARIEAPLTGSASPRAPAI